MKTELYNEELPVTLGEDEITALGRELAHVVKERDDVEVERKSAAAKYKRRIDALTERIDVVQLAINTGIETRKVACERRIDAAARTVTCYRLDTGEEIDRYPLTDDALQMDVEEFASAEQSPSDTSGEICGEDIEIPFSKAARAKAHINLADWSDGVVGMALEYNIESLPIVDGGFIEYPSRKAAITMAYTDLCDAVEGLPRTKKNEQTKRAQAILDDLETWYNQQLELMGEVCDPAGELNGADG